MRQLRRQNLLCTVPVAAFIAHEVSTCLGYAHDLLGPDGKRLNIVHRDVSPSNIMCLRTGGVKLLDFGIAKAAGDNTENTEQGLFKGKLAYVAPERIRNEPLDGRVDLFGLGVVLWEMLAGKRLFRGKSELETLNNVLEMVVPPPSSLRPDVPASLDAVVLRALERDRDKRYPNGQAMADDLEAVLRETSFHSRMLPDLLREAFGSEASRTLESLSSVTPEMLASLTGDTETGSGTAVQPTDATQRTKGSWKKTFAVITASAVTATLGILLLGRGGGGRLLAREPASVALPATAIIAPLIEPAPAPAGAAPSPTEPPPRSSPPADSAGDDGAQRSKGSHRHRSSSRRQRVQADRVARGLSIDPFKP
jgi:serine/threonine-protein kinase